MFPDLDYGYMTRLSQGPGYTPLAPPDFTYSAQATSEEIGRILSPANMAKQARTPPPPEYYSGFLGWEPGAAIANARRNMMIMLGGIVGIIGLITALIIVIMLTKK